VANSGSTAAAAGEHQAAAEASVADVLELARRLGATSIA
jgi:hypothetical protein